MLSRRAVSAARLLKPRGSSARPTIAGLSRAPSALPGGCNAAISVASRRFYSDDATLSAPTQPSDGACITRRVWSKPKERSISKIVKAFTLRNWSYPTIRLIRENSSETNIPKFWLRDACPCHLCRDPDSGQRTFSSTTIPDAPEAQEVHVGGDGSLTVVWAGKEPPHKSTWTAAEVGRWKYGSIPSNYTERVPTQRSWTLETLTRRLPYCRISFEEWTAGGGPFWRALKALHMTGLLFVKGVPESHTAVEELARAIGPLQETFYGKTWDVVSKPHAENVAYTSQFLGLHQDLLYWKETPRIQLLHCLSNSCDGGESLFGDGFHAAEKMQEHRYLYHALLQPTATFHYDKDGHRHSRTLPTIVCDKKGNVKRINWSPPFQGLPALPRHGTRQVQALLSWRAAARLFEEEISKPENMYEYKLQPGECVIMDNHRILHGRQMFNTSAGERHLKGCYVSQNSYVTKLIELNQERLSMD